jgi:RNA polymerase sigma factor (sigma-70 family)
MGTAFQSHEGFVPDTNSRPSFERLFSLPDMACASLTHRSGPAPDGWDARAAVADHEGRLMARIRLMMGPEAREAAESGDVLQSVYADTLASLEAGKVLGPDLLPWMTRVARHKIVDEVRRQRERPGAMGSGDSFKLAGGESTSPPLRVTAEESGDALREALSTLDPVRRSVLELRGLEGRAWSEIALELGRSEEAVRKLYHRTLVDLGRALALHRLDPDESIRE